MARPTLSVNAQSFMPYIPSSLSSGTKPTRGTFTPTSASGLSMDTSTKELINLNKALCDQLVQERENHRVTKMELQAEKQRRVLAESEHDSTARMNRSLAASVKMLGSIVKHNLSKLQEFTSDETVVEKEQRDEIGNGPLQPGNTADIENSILYDVLEAQKGRYQSHAYPELLEPANESEVLVLERPFCGGDQTDPFDLDLLQTPNSEDFETPKAKMSRALRRHFLDQGDPAYDGPLDQTLPQVSEGDRLIEISPPEVQLDRVLEVVTETKPEIRRENRTQATPTREAAAGQHSKPRKPSVPRAITPFSIEASFNINDRPATTATLGLPTSSVANVANYRQSASQANMGNTLSDITNRYGAANVPQPSPPINPSAPTFEPGKGEEVVSARDGQAKSRGTDSNVDDVVQRGHITMVTTDHPENALSTLSMNDGSPANASPSTTSVVGAEARVTILTPYAVAMNWKINANNPLFDDDGEYQRARRGSSDVFWLHPVRFQPDREEPNLYRTVMIDFIPLGSELKHVLAELARVRPGELESIQFLPRIGNATDFMTARVIFHSEHNAQTLVLEAEHGGIFVNGQKVRVWMVLTAKYPRNRELDQDVFINNYTRIFLLDNMTDRLINKLPDKLQSNKQVNMAFVVGMVEEVDGTVRTEFTSIAEAARAFRALRADREYRNVIIDFVNDYCAPAPAPAVIA